MTPNQQQDSDGHPRIIIQYIKLTRN